MQRTRFTLAICFSSFLLGGLWGRWGEPMDMQFVGLAAMAGAMTTAVLLRRHLAEHPTNIFTYKLSQVNVSTNCVPEWKSDSAVQLNVRTSGAGAPKAGKESLVTFDLEKVLSEDFNYDTGTAKKYKVVYQGRFGERISVGIEVTEDKVLLPGEHEDYKPVARHVLLRVKSEKVSL